jgi:Cu(I)/Ag(I) efflux system protein CusF
MKTLLLPVALLAAACSPPASEPAAKTDMESASEPAAPAAPAAAGQITSVGTVIAVDAAAGTVSLDHEAIAAIRWPAMSMQFTAENPAILQGIAVGDRVAFELKSASETQTLIAIQKQ